ncbi:MAG TPA: hypothetical protein VER03_11575 [Bryobacteraceae bacterium]|nr:hypothetical protein [Bryobacteraceae bacterium]
MASKRRETSAKPEEQARKVDVPSSVLVKPAVNVVDIATGESESLWVWELED